MEQFFPMFFSSAYQRWSKLLTAYNLESLNCTTVRTSAGCSSSSSLFIPPTKRQSCDLFSYQNRGLAEGTKGRKKESNPFREAFGRVKDLRSVLPGIPLLALSNCANEWKGQTSESLWDTGTYNCGRVSKQRKHLSELYSHSQWKGCSNSFEMDCWHGGPKKKGVPTNNYILQHIQWHFKCFELFAVNFEGKSLYNQRWWQKGNCSKRLSCQTWDTQKMAIEEDFKSDDLKEQSLQPVPLVWESTFLKCDMWCSMDHPWVSLTWCNRLVVVEGMVARLIASHTIYGSHGPGILLEKLLGPW